MKRCAYKKGKKNNEKLLGTGTWIGGEFWHRKLEQYFDLHEH